MEPMENSQSYETMWILDQMLKFEWLYEKVFWKLLDPLVFDRAIDNGIHLLKNVYGMNDADDCFKRKVERNEFRWLSKILFKFKDSTPDNPK